MDLAGLKLSPQRALPASFWHKATEPPLAVTLGLTQGDQQVLVAHGWGPGGDEMIAFLLNNWARPTENDRVCERSTTPAHIAPYVRLEIARLHVLGDAAWDAAWKKSRERAHQLYLFRQRSGGGGKAWEA